MRIAGKDPARIDRWIVAASTRRILAASCTVWKIT